MKAYQPRLPVRAGERLSIPDGAGEMRGLRAFYIKETMNRHFAGRRHFQRKPMQRRGLRRRRFGECFRLGKGYALRHGGRKT